MTDRTYLDTSDGMAAYATSHGAKYDKVRGQWYVEGEVPSDLVGLIPKKPNKYVHIVAPSCPVCGCHMVERKRTGDGHLFWGCSQYPRCKGTVAFEDHLDCIEPLGPKSVTDFLKFDDGVTKSSSSKNNKLSSMSPALRLAVERVVALAADVLGGSGRVEKWLSSPKVTLKGRIPLELMDSVEGCLLVEKLLRSIQA